MKALYLKEIDSDKAVIFAEDELVIGRTFLEFQCEDNRISRKHGLLTKQSEDKLVVKSTHSNPIFYKIVEEEDVKILATDEQVTLGHKDRFALLEDQFWYEIELRDDGQNGAVGLLRVRNVAEVNAEVPVNEEEEPPSVQPRRLPGWMLMAQNSQTDQQTENAPAKRTNGDLDEENEGSSPKRARSDDEPSTSTDEGATAAAAATSSDGPVVKEEVDEKKPIVIKKEEADSSSLRPSCDFGIRCFRRNPEHRLECAHPGDVDYRRPSFPPAPPDAPPCPWGASCYRRNPTHFQMLSHPDPSTTIPPPTTPQPSQNIPLTRTPPQRRRRQVLSNSDLDDMEEEDEYDMSDPFMADDNSSDEYQPSNDDDEEEILSDPENGESDDGDGQRNED